MPWPSPVGLSSPVTLHLVRQAGVTRPGFPVTMIRAGDAGLRRVNVQGTVKEKWADLKKCSRFTGLVLALMGVMKLLNDLGKPRVESLRGVDVLGLVRCGRVVGGRLRWPVGQAEFRQLPEGPKQAATERVGCVEGARS